MSGGDVGAVLQRALYVALMVGGPIVLASMAVGLIISVFQAATQINEATLSFLPKFLAVLATLVVAGPWMIQLLVDYIQRLFSSIPSVIG